MSESGGRRIARGYTVKLNNISPCSKYLLEKIKKTFATVQNFATEIEEKSIDTNIELFRIYANAYLNNHPHIRKDMIIMVRTLEPTGNGLPIQFYCFTDITDWVEYENIQAQIMEHFASVMPFFELYPYQSTSSRDTIISGMLEANFPIDRINGIPRDTTK